ncbi:hypothetical protein Bca101_051132 [Brassica carinata]
MGVLTFSVRLMFLILCIFINGSFSKLERLGHPVTKSDGSLDILVFGDWGRKGGFNQSLVAHQMGIVGEQLDIDFVISVGDNFYDDGLKGDTDTSFEASFSHIYTHPSLQKQWYSGMVEFFFVDTNPFVKKYFTDPEDHTYDWSNVLPRKKYIYNLLHENKVDLYINGHDHCLQHIGSEGEIQFLTSGGGSKAWRGDIQPWDPKELKLYYDGQGFMSLRITHSEVKFVFYDISGNVLHQSRLSKKSKTFGLF